MRLITLYTVVAIDKTRTELINYVHEYILFNRVIKSIEPQPSPIKLVTGNW